MTLELRTAHIPLAFGLQTGQDPRAIKLPTLTIAENVQFDNRGGLVSRFPYREMPTTVLGGGTLEPLRRLAVNGDELLLFTQDALYAFSERDQAWVRRGDYVAPVVRETPAFARTTDQIFADCAELLGVRVLVWSEPGSGGVGEDIYLAATDVETGAVLVAPTVLVGGSSRPRIVALTTKFVVTRYNGLTVFAGPIDPGNLATSITGFGAASFSLGASSTGVYDLVSGFGLAWAAVDNQAVVSYVLTRITDAVTVGTTTTTTEVRRADRIAVAVRPDDGSQIMIVRYNATTIRADHRNSTTLVMLTANQDLGTPSNATVNQIAAAFSSVLDSFGRFRCFAFWSSGETGGAGPTATFTTQTNWVNTGGDIGTLRTFVRRMGVASRAFDCSGRVYVWLAFAGETGAVAGGAAFLLGLRSAFQNAYFLYRDEDSASFVAPPLAKAVAERAGGFSAVAGLLPGVQEVTTNVFQWTGIERRIILLGPKQTGYSGRTPRVIRLTLDSDEARRVARIGRTLYISGGLVMQYDGVGLVEVGFHIAPWDFQMVNVGGLIPPGTYNYKLSLSWVNGVAERERSTAVVARGIEVPINSTMRFDTTTTPFLYVTHKLNLRSPPSLEYWRTAVNPVADTPFQLVSSVDPAFLANPNRYVPNDPSDANAPQFEDNMYDQVPDPNPIPILPNQVLATKEAFPENGQVLESLPPVPGTIVVATQDRLIMAGLADDPNGIAYSKLRGDGETVAFHPALRLFLPPDGGPITALAYVNETLFAWKERACFAVPGDGFDNLGGGDNYGPGRVISLDVGAESQEAIATTPMGVVFKSLKGWYLLDRSFNCRYIGEAVREFDSEVVKGAHVVESQHQVRIYTSSRVLVWDYDERVNQWASWKIDGSGALSSVIWLGIDTIIDGAGGVPRDQRGIHDGTELVGADFETAWINLADLQGYQRIWRLQLLGEYRSACRIRVRLKRDYDDTTYFQDKTWTISPTVVGGPLQVKHSPSIQQCQAMKIRITLVDAVTDDIPPAGEGARFTGIGIEYGVQQGLFRRLPAAQKQ